MYLRTLSTLTTLFLVLLFVVMAWAVPSATSFSTATLGTDTPAPLCAHEQDRYKNLQG
ncbi:hypothetical protein [Sneathiella chinensis]|uniref:Uncharacterized protein n=1 Tax=Sneathiella chinensis TaxID=349750 RepID=A0ABQ5U5U1_9PROT|nr:hypothetical protein [Sneathiella chinensis]GLQ07078.1 hypothetical protein GCM10007924_22990 [Sneathiella chinensis]